MYTDIPLWLSLAFLAVGLAALAWSSDLFVDGAATVARSLGISPFVVGMVVIGFGTSAPELCVSAMSGIAGHSNLSLGNAYGSCVFNIAAILGVAALMHPLKVKPAVALVAGPVLAAVALVSGLLLKDGVCGRFEALALLGAFLVLLPLYCWFDQKTNAAPSEAAPGCAQRFSWVAVVKLVVGLAALVGASHVLVWGAVDVARALGVSELMIGLTIVAVGTSLPELASAVASARRGENEFVLGNIIGSNLFNTLAVVGLAASISPAIGFSPYILSRDLPTMAALSLSITFFGLNWRRPREGGLAGRAVGALWLALFFAYTALVVWQETR